METEQADGLIKGFNCLTIQELQIGQANIKFNLYFDRKIKMI